LVQSGSANLGAQLDTLWSRRGDLSPEGVALLGLSLEHVADKRVPAAAQLLESRAKQTDEVAYWPSNYNPLLEFDADNSAESTAFALRFLIHADPQSPLLSKSAEWLMLNRSGGYWWTSTEQTAMVIYGLTDYLAASQELNADFDIDVTVNGVKTAERHFSPADALYGTTLEIAVPADKLASGSNTVILNKHGRGRAYWTVQGTYFSADRKLYQKGTLTLNLTRDYFRLVPEQQKDKIVYRLDPLRGPVAIGDVLAVHLAVNGTPEKYLLVEDPIAAGTEFVKNDDSYDIVGTPDTWTDWYTRREFHDDHAAIFATEFDGRNESYYLLRVVNPGSFTISPAYAGPMYQPSVQATSDALHLDVTTAVSGGAK
jgi:uncharacterized protein YfaS (alpha-2-macroglobulin family)